MRATEAQRAPIAARIRGIRRNLGIAMASGAVGAIGSIGMASHWGSSMLVAAPVMLVVFALVWLLVAYLAGGRILREADTTDAVSVAGTVERVQVFRPRGIYAVWIGGVRYTGFGVPARVWEQGEQVAFDALPRSRVIL